MAVEVVKAKMYQRRDTTTNWLKYNPILASGEFGYDTNEKKYKIGDGVSHWTDLQFSYIGVITDENGNTLRYKKVASEDYVNERITSSVIFAQSKGGFPSIGKINTLYIDLTDNKAYIWEENNLQYSTIGTDVTLPEEELRPLVEDVLDIVLVDKLNINVPPIVESMLNSSVLSGGSSSEETN